MNLDLKEIAEWVKNLCLMSGASTHTAYLVAGYFVQGLAEHQAKLDKARGGK